MVAVAAEASRANDSICPHISATARTRGRARSITGWGTAGLRRDVTFGRIGTVAAVAGLDRGPAYRRNRGGTPTVLVAGWAIRRVLRRRQSETCRPRSWTGAGHRAGRNTVHRW